MPITIHDQGNLENESERMARIKPVDVPGKIWTVATQLQGLSELFRAVRGDSEPFTERGCCGIGYFIADIADELDAVLDALDGACENVDSNDKSEFKTNFRNKKR